jgi:hypothetical protein
MPEIQGFRPVDELPHDLIGDIGRYAEGTGCLVAHAIAQRANECRR